MLCMLRGCAGVLGPTYMRPGEAALVAAVLGTGAAQDDLVPALMHVYAGADNVVGLDVDRDRFDKFHFRSMIDGLLETLWKDEGQHFCSCLCLTSHAGCDPPSRRRCCVSAIKLTVGYMDLSTISRAARLSPGVAALHCHTVG